MTNSNIKPVTRCPKCLAAGVVHRKEKTLVSLECPECSHRWKTYSKICKDCGKPNGYVVEGPCMECYAQHYKTS